MTKPRHQPHRFRQPSARRPVSRFDFIEGVARLAASGAVEITDLVEGIHREIVVKPFERVIPGWSSYWDRSISSKVYCVVRKAMSFSGKATAFMGPFFLGYFTQLFNSQRYGIAVVLFFLVIGTILLRSVNEEAGIAAAQSPEVT